MAKVDEIERSRSSAGVTLGPSRPPIEFEAPAFVGRIHDLTERALEQGWIRNRGLAQSMEAKLDAAAAALARGGNGTAINVLNALINELDAQAGKQLSPDAVALLKINTEYLLSKIQ